MNAENAAKTTVYAAWIVLQFIAELALKALITKHGNDQAEETPSPVSVARPLASAEVDFQTGRTNFRPRRIYRVEYRPVFLFTSQPKRQAWPAVIMTVGQAIERNSQQFPVRFPKCLVARENLGMANIMGRVVHCSRICKAHTVQNYGTQQKGSGNL